MLAYFKKNAIGTFSGNQDPIVKKATDDYAKTLQQDMQLSHADAATVAGQVIPATMSEMASKTADPSDKSFSLQDIFSKLSGGKSDKIDFQQKLKNFDGGKLDHNMDGKVDAQDLKSMFTGEDGVFNKLKGMFK